MKKIYLGLIVTLLPVTSFGQVIDVSVIENFDVHAATSCNKETLSCQKQITDLQNLITVLLQQIVTLQITGESTEKLTVGQSQEDEGVDVEQKTTEPQKEVLDHERVEYLLSLKGDLPLRNGEKKNFDLRGTQERRLDLRREPNEGTHPVYKEIWRIFSSFIPQDTLRHFEELHFYHDTEESVSAYVYTHVRGNNEIEYELNVNLANVMLDSDENYNATVELLAHEAAHALSVNLDQLDLDERSADCETFFFSDLQACAVKGSYFHVFSDFWDDEFAQYVFDNGKLFDRGKQEKAEKKRSAYYKENTEKFVSEYATTDRYEDVAESMMYFFVYPIPTGALTIADEKVVVFYDFDETVAIRRVVQSFLR